MVVLRYSPAGCGFEKSRWRVHYSSMEYGDPVGWESWELEKQSRASFLYSTIGRIALAKVGSKQSFLYNHPPSRMTSQVNVSHNKSPERNIRQVTNSPLELIEQQDGKVWEIYLSRLDPRNLLPLWGRRRRRRAKSNFFKNEEIGPCIQVSQASTTFNPGNKFRTGNASCHEQRNLFESDPKPKDPKDVRSTGSSGSWGNLAIIAITYWDGTTRFNELRKTQAPDGVEVAETLIAQPLVVVDTVELIKLMIL